MYAARILRQAANELEELDKPVGRRIINELHGLSQTWIASNLSALQAISKVFINSVKAIIESSIRYFMMKKPSSFTVSAIPAKFTVSNKR